MFIVLCYDIEAERINRIHKIAKKYLVPVQKSVLEGNLTERSLFRMKQDIAAAIDPEKDSVIIYAYANVNQVSKEQIGIMTKGEHQFL